MNYELAKRLEGAGFTYGSESSTPLRGEGWPTDDGWLKTPSLSELIDACGLGFTLLAALDDLHVGGWIAKEVNGDVVYKGEGSTPEEAVGELWLKLHST